MDVIGQLALEKGSRIGAIDPDQSEVRKVRDRTCREVYCLGRALGDVFLPGAHAVSPVDYRFDA
jgi:hypothetical protein